MPLIVVIAEALVEMLEVFVPVVEFKLVIAEALAPAELVTVTISACAEAIAVPCDVTVEFNELYSVTKVASLALSQPLLAAFLT